MLDRITPLVLTRDEEPNIARTLGQLTWANEVIVVDSFSTDATVSIARRFPNVRILEREIDTLAGQSNFGLHAARTPWVLLLDADYFVSTDVVDELRRLEPPPATRAYRGCFVYAINGRHLRASLYPRRVVLLDRNHARVLQDGHAHRVSVEGEVGDLRACIIHDDRKSFRNFVARQRRYMRQEAEKLRTADAASLNLPSRIRKWIFIAPFAVLFHTLVVKRVIFDGAAGIRYTAERVVAEAILSWELLTTRRKHPSPPAAPPASEQ
jgi:glycosyltransferase involved in cell wall biosynthesis